MEVSYLNILSFQLLPEKTRGFPWVHRAAAREDVHSRVAVFRPSVNSQVRLGDHNHARDTLRIEILKRSFQHSRSRNLRCLGHYLL